MKTENKKSNLEKRTRFGNSITQLPTYQKQAEKIEQARTLRKIGWGIPLFAGMGGALFVLGAFAFYSTTKYESNKEKK